jgi:hypothetical protein
MYISSDNKTIKPNPPKDGDGKPRVLASSATFDATKDPKIAELPKTSLKSIDFLA